MANRGVKIFLIIILTIIAIILMNIMILKIMNKDLKIDIFAFGNKTEKIFENEYEINGIKNMNIDSFSSNIKFIEGEKDKIRVTAYGAKDENISVAINGDSLDIKKDNQVLHIFMLFCWYREEIVVEIPKSFEGNIRLSASSGNIEVIDLENSNLNLEASSGNIRCGNMINGNIKTSSGNINAGSGKDINIKASSGSIKAGKVEKGTANTSSGSIKIDELKEGEVRASSGAIWVGKMEKRKNRNNFRKYKGR